jgi:uncharacterized protein YggT (Ycf19 family)
MIKGKVEINGTEEKVNYTSRVIWFIIGVLIALLVIRIILSLLGAYGSNPFVSFVYGLTEPFVMPFQGMFPIDKFEQGVSTFDIPAVVAIVVYTLVGWLFSAAVGLLSKKR